ncbi:19450_t:CDS:2, partial [Rhizophagus irregularis]
VVPGDSLVKFPSLPRFLLLQRHEFGRMGQICIHCDAKFWIEDKDRDSCKPSPSFAVCCTGGKISLPPLLKPPLYLLNLYISSSSDANSFRKNI